MTTNRWPLWLLVASVAFVPAACSDSESEPTTTIAVTTTPPTTVAEHDMSEHEHAGEHDMQGHEGTGHESEVDIMYSDLPADIAAEVAVTKALVEKYPSAADATKAGWQKATINLNGIGAHYLKGGPVGFLNDYEFDAANPNVLLYDGEGPDAKIAGASFILTEPNPTGYTGDLDVWHFHYGVCFDTKKFIVIGEVDGHDGSKINMTSAECTAAGAVVYPIKDLYMIHVWVAPGYIEDAPVFAHDHPKLANGTPTGSTA